MRIEAVDWFYCAMPEILDIGDGSQDALLVRIRGGGYEGWGESEAAPLVSIASFVCPPSHSACKPLSTSVLGQRLDSVDDIHRISAEVRANSADLLQTDHTLSGLDIAMWDLLGRRYEVPVHELLGAPIAYPKTPYASQLFGDQPEETYQRAIQVRRDGFTAAKFGWGPFGLGSVDDDAAHLAAAREGLGVEADLLVDAGTIWGDDVQRAEDRLKHLNAQRVLFLEEPFVAGALSSYKSLSQKCRPLRLAGGEGSHDYYTGMHTLEYGGVDFLQIDAGRVGGITVAAKLAAAATARGVTFLNHTFTSDLALSASVQPFVGIESARLCEYPVAKKALAVDLTTTSITPDGDGELRMPSGPGLGVEVNVDAIHQYHQDVRIEVNGAPLHVSALP